MFPVSLYLENFLSFEQQTYAFKRGVPVLIQGKNLSKRGQQSNGSGKSSLQAAMEYCLTKSTGRKVREVDLIRRGTKAAEVRVVIEDSVRGQILEVRRRITKSGSTCDIYINGDEPQEDLANIDDKNDFIYRWLGIQKDDIQNYYILNSEYYTPFFKTSNTKKIEIISRMYDFTMVDSAINRLDEEAENISVTSNEIQQEIYRIEGSIESIEESIENLESDEDFEKLKTQRIEQNTEILTQKNETLKDYQSKYDSYKQQLVKIEQDYLKQSEELEKIKKEAPKKDTKVFDDLDATLSDGIKEINLAIQEVEELKNGHENYIAQVNSEIRKIEVKLAGTVSCPKCEHEFIPDDNDQDIKELNEQIKKQELDVENTTKEVESCNGLIVELKEDIKSKEQEISNNQIDRREYIKKYNQEMSRIYETQSELDRISSKIESIKINVKNYQGYIANTQNDIKNIESTIESIKEEKPDTATSIKLKQQLKDKKQQLEDKRKEHNDNREKEVYTNVWSFNMRKFKAYLSNKVLRIIQDKVNLYLDDMKSDIRIQIEGFKQLADGRLKEEITPYIIDNGDVVVYNSLSKGEQARVEYACIIAIQDLINELHGNGGLDMIFSDEIAEGLDPLGVKNLLTSLEPFNKTILVTTHVAIYELYDNTVLIENKNNISKIIE